MSEKPYIVLLGDVGAGKSTIVEKLTGNTGRSSASSRSVTIASEVFESYDERLIVCDTPGSNAMGDKFTHNIHIAHAMNSEPVTCVLIVVKADTRIDNVIRKVTDYADGFIPDDLPIELIGVCVTHMDVVSWTSSDLLTHLKRQLGIETAVFCSPITSREALTQDLLNECSSKRPVALNVDGEMFLNLFRIDSNNIKALHEARKEVEIFKKMKQDFYRQKVEENQETDRMDMVFEFQALMLEEIIEAQKRLSINNNFTFTGGPEMASEAGHIANMTFQLRKVLSSVCSEAATFHKDIDTDFRKCPYCAAVWMRIEGCEGETTCGSRQASSNVLREGCKMMSTYQFTWDSVFEKLTIKKHVATENTNGNSNKAGTGVGCGSTVNWCQMAPVKPLNEFHVSPFSMQGVFQIQKPDTLFKSSKMFLQDKLFPKSKTNEDNYDTRVKVKSSEQRGHSATSCLASQESGSVLHEDLSVTKTKNHVSESSSQGYQTATDFSDPIAQEARKTWEQRYSSKKDKLPKLAVARSNACDNKSEGDNYDTRVKMKNAEPTGHSVTSCLASQEIGSVIHEDLSVRERENLASEMSSQHYQTTADISDLMTQGAPKTRDQSDSSKMNKPLSLEITRSKAGMRECDDSNSGNAMQANGSSDKPHQLVTVKSFSTSRDDTNNECGNRIKENTSMHCTLL